MRQKLAGLYLILKDIGDFKIDSLEDRVFTQKAIYLLQVLGVDLRYRFSWYKRGPYCRDLTFSVYDIGEQEKSYAERLRLRSRIRPALDKLKEIIAKKPEDLDQASHWLELVSSMHYLKHIAKVPGVSRESVQEHLKRVGKDFSPSQVDRAWQVLSDANLIDKKVSSLVN